MTASQSAEAVLRALGIIDPNDIDIEAIAYHCGATVRYRPLDGCAARIIGRGNRAIISVDANEHHPGRRRFSVAHELGHWMLDRGRTLLCQPRDLRAPWYDHPQLNREAMANRYAADLLLPVFLFKPAAATLEMTFDSVDTLTNSFQTSATATAIRLVDYGPYPAMLVCYNTSGRCWFTRGPDVPETLWPVRELPQQTYAFDLLFDDKPYPTPVLSDAEDWIDHRSSHDHTIVEHGIKIASDTVLVMLWWRDEEQLTNLV